MNENYKLISDIVQLCSVIIASSIAIYGISSWRREAAWKRKYELSEEVLALFYECREKIQMIRSPYGYSNEGTSRKKNENETVSETEILNNAYVPIERYENVKESFIKLLSLKSRFMALFGKESQQPFNEIKIILNQIFQAATVLGRQYWKEHGHKKFTEEEFQKHLERMHEKESLIWHSVEENDLTTERIEKCIKVIENYCESIMNTKPSSSLFMSRFIAKNPFKKILNE